MGGTLDVGTLRYILSVEALLRRELKDERVDIHLMLVSLSTSALCSAAICDGCVGEELFFLVPFASVVSDELLNCWEDRRDMHAAAGSRMTVLVILCWLFVLSGDELRFFSSATSSLRDGELDLDPESHVFRENILRAPAPRPCDFTDAASPLSMCVSPLSESSISAADTNLPADIRFFVF